MVFATPSVMRAVLEEPRLGLALRFALALPFLQSAIAKSSDRPGAMSEMTLFGLPGVTAYAVIGTQSLGAALLLLRSWCWLGTGMLAIFTVLATLLVHAFWRFHGIERVHQAATFSKHIAIIGGLAVVAVLARRVPGR